MNSFNFIIFVERICCFLVTSRTRFMAYIDTEKPSVDENPLEYILLRQIFRPPKVRSHRPLAVLILSYTNTNFPSLKVYVSQKSFKYIYHHIVYLHRQTLSVPIGRKVSITRGIYQKFVSTNVLQIKVLT